MRKTSNNYTWRKTNMGKITDTNNEMVSKYRLDETILESYFKNAKNQNVTGLTFPLRVDNR